RPRAAQGREGSARRPDRRRRQRRRTQSGEGDAGEDGRARERFRSPARLQDAVLDIRAGTIRAAAAAHAARYFMSEIPSLEALKQALRRLPGVGPKSAQRMAFHLLERDREGARAIAQA